MTYTTLNIHLQRLLSADVYRTGRLLYTRKPTAPSIPTPGQNCGYDETEEGNLTPQQLPPHDSTMGPAYYNVSHVRENAIKVQVYVCIYNVHVHHVYIIICMYTLYFTYMLFVALCVGIQHVSKALTVQYNYYNCWKLLNEL